MHTTQDSKINTLRLNGQTIKTGFAQGKAFNLKQPNLLLFQKTCFSVPNITSELAKLNKAVATCKQQLLSLYEAAKGHNPLESIAHFQRQYFCLESSAFLTKISKIVVREKINVEHLIAKYLQYLAGKIAAPAEREKRARLQDREAVFYRLLCQLAQDDLSINLALKDISEPIILFTDSLTPSLLASFNLKNILALVLETSAPASHTTIMLQSLPIPSLLVTSGTCALVRDGDHVLVDGLNGKLVFAPKLVDVEQARSSPGQTTFTGTGKVKVVFTEHGCSLQDSSASSTSNDDNTATAYTSATKQPEKNKTLKQFTRDGYRIKLEVSLSSSHDLKLALYNRAEGVGLLRSEFYYMSQERLPTSNKESRFYVSLLHELAGKPLTIRLLDLTSNKQPSYLPVDREINPQLGKRGLRWLLEQEAVFYNHLSSILEASRFAPLRILIPFVTVLDELEQVLYTIKCLCRIKNISSKSFKIGMMIETPASLMQLSSYLQNLDFVSIGTNDLLQHFFAVSRDDQGLDKYRKSYHPVILRTIKHIVDYASEFNKPVSICGEAALDPVTLPLLVGLHCRSLTVNPAALPDTRRRIAGFYYSDVKELANQALCLRRAEEVYSLLSETLDITN